jgi:hypothetical protein
MPGMWSELERIFAQDGGVTIGIVRVLPVSGLCAQLCSAKIKALRIMLVTQLGVPTISRQPIENSRSTLVYSSIPPK